MLIGHSFIFFGDMSLQILCPIFNWVVFLLLSCKYSLCILNTSPLSDTWFAGIPSFSWALLKIFIMSLEVQNRMSNLWYFPFYLLCSSDWLIQITEITRMFSQNFIILELTFIFVFTFIFIFRVNYCVRYEVRVQINLCLCGYLIPSAVCWKDNPFPIEFFFLNF